MNSVFMSVNQCKSYTKLSYLHTLMKMSIQESRKDFQGALFEGNICAKKCHTQSSDTFKTQ